MNLELSPSEFEEHVMGRKQDWKQSLLVEVGQQDRAGMQQALPLGTWLRQHSIAVDQHGMLMAAKPSRFAQEAGLQPHPSLSGPPAHHTARYVPPYVHLAPLARAVSVAISQSCSMLGLLLVLVMACSCMVGLAHEHACT